jgi:hypothetical protein
MNPVDVTPLAIAPIDHDTAPSSRNENRPTPSDEVQKPPTEQIGPGQQRDTVKNDVRILEQIFRDPVGDEMNLIAFLCEILC